MRANLTKKRKRKWLKPWPFNLGLTDILSFPITFYQKEKTNYKNAFKFNIKSFLSKIDFEKSIHIHTPTLSCLKV